MYIAPDTTIGIISDAPLDPTYNHTLYWNTANDQEYYFTSKRKYTLTQQSYQRHAKGTMRVAIKAENLYDCNYLMFQNSAFGNKWFYAFITKVEYINNGTSEITYEMDVLQTWFFDYELKESFVEREHTDNDAIGAHTVPEGLELGDYYVDNSGLVPNPHRAGPDGGLVVVTTFDQFNPTHPDFDGGEIKNRLYTGLQYRYYADYLDVNHLIGEAIELNKVDGIIAIYMCPITWDNVSDLYIDNISIPKTYGAFQGYTPKNKKLYTYPYNVLHVYNDQNCADFRMEYFTGSSCGFTLYQSMIPDPNIVMVPSGYAKGSWELRLSSTLYPMCPYNTNVYETWAAANANSNAVRMLGLNVQQGFNAVDAVAGTIGNAVGFNFGGAVNSAYSGIKNATNTQLQIMAVNAQKADLKTKPAQMNGAQQSGMDWSIEAKDFRWKCLKIRGEYAKIIDEYFTMFGYACRRVKVPNTNARSRWTYTKTVGCVVRGSIPSDDIVTICNIYDRGITFWVNPGDVGNYSLENLPVVG